MKVCGNCQHFEFKSTQEHNDKTKDYDYFITCFCLSKERIIHRQLCQLNYIEGKDVPAIDGCSKAIEA